MELDCQSLTEVRNKFKKLILSTPYITSLDNPLNLDLNMKTINFNLLLKQVLIDEQSVVRKFQTDLH